MFDFYTSGKQGENKQQKDSFLGLQWADWQHKKQPVNRAKKANFKILIFTKKKPV